MAKEPQSKEIDGHMYSVQMLGGSDGWKMLLKLSKMLGPSLGKIVAGGTDNIASLMDKEIGGGAFLADAIEAFVNNVDEPSASVIIEKMKDVTTVNGTPLRGVFELHFQGDAFGVVKWLRFALQAQYQNFSAASGNESLAPVPLKAQG